MLLDEIDKVSSDYLSLIHISSDKFVTNGAFTLKEWNHDSSMTYVKNPNYWDADKVTVLVSCVS